MKHLHQNQEFRFNEVLFEGRNKEYGAYVLRNESDRILTRALFVGVSLLAAASLTPLVISAFKTSDPIVETPTSGPFIIQNVYEEPETPPTAVVPPKATAAPEVKTFDNTVPEPKAHVTNEKVVEKIEGAVAGLKNNSEGEIAPPNVHISTTPSTVTGPVITNVQPPVVPKVEDNTPKTKVDIEATFEGGIDAFRNKVLAKFDPSGFEDEGVIKTTITFIVEKDGTISGIKADGMNGDFNSEALRTIKSVKGKWTPAKVKGESVRSYFKFPISMKFDN